MFSKKRVQVKQVGGTIKNVVLYFVTFCTTAKANLLSITSLLSQSYIPIKDTINDILALIKNEKFVWIKLRCRYFY